MANALEWLGNMLASQRMAPRMPTLDEAAYRINALAAGDPVSARGPGMGPIMAGPEDYLAGSFDAITPGIPVNALTIAGRGARTADNALLKVAREAEKKGLPPARVFDATGWFRGGDGKWRFEIDDSAARFNVTPATGKETDILHGYGDLDVGPVYSRNSGILTHQQLADAYDAAEIAPHLNVKDNLTYLRTERGAFNPDSKTMTLYAPVSAADGKSTILHETQHAIQGREGFARGGSPDSFAFGGDETTRLATQLRATQQRYAEAKATGRDPYGIEDSVAAVKREMDSAKQQWDAHRKELTAIREGGAHEAYRRLAGETEARNVQTRMGMSPDDRRMRPPWTTEDVPRDRQIVHEGGGTAMSAPRLAPQDNALAIAQRNAALPVEQGGLGLAPNNTAMDRAAALGFDTPAYHGTGADITQFDIDKMYSGEGASHGGSGFYFTDDPSNASNFAYLATSKGGDGNVIPVLLKPGKQLQIDAQGGEVYGANHKFTKKQVKDILSGIPNLKSTEDSPLLNYGDIDYEGFNTVLNRAVDAYAGGNNLAALRNDMFGDDHSSWLNALEKATKYNSAVQKNMYGDNHHIMWRPEQIRSRFAAFDPLRRNESDLLAGIMPWAVPAGNALLLYQLAAERDNEGI